MRTFAVALLCAGIVHNVAHRYVPEDARGYVWNVTGALLTMGLLLTVAVLSRHWAVWLVVALLAGHALQVAGCSVAYLWQPWPLLDDGDLCSDSMALPLAALGIVAVALFQASRRE